MKKVLAIVLGLALTCVALPSRAQVKLGVKGGLNISDMSISKKAFDTSNQTGFFIGPTLKISLPLTGLGIDVAALYDQRSAKLNTLMLEGDDAVGRKETLKQQYINIPINLRYGIGLGSLASIYLSAGPQFGFNVGDKGKKIFDKSVDWQLKKSVFSVNLGAGVSLLKHIEVGANYNIVCGKTGELTFIDGVDAAWKGRNSAWQIYAAYYF